MRILITGGAGFIGSHIADALIADGHTVCVVDDLRTGHRHNVPKRAQWVKADVRDAETMHALFADFRPDAVSHQAAQTSVSVSVQDALGDASVNILGSLTLFEACVKHRVNHVVLASTGGAIYGEVPEAKRAADTSWPAQPMSPYACSKYSAEQYLRMMSHLHGLNATVLRYANVYGPRQDPHGEAGVVAIFAARLLAGLPLQINARTSVGDAGCLRDYVYIDDVVAANCAALLGQASHPMINVGTGVATSTQRVAELLAAALDKTPTFTFAEPRVGDLKRSVLLPGHTNHTDHGALMTPLEEGLAKTAAWFCDDDDDE